MRSWLLIYEVTAQRACRDVFVQTWKTSTAYRSSPGVSLRGRGDLGQLNQSQAQTQTHAVVGLG